LEFFKDEKEKTVFIIGGGEIYKMALDSGRIDEMFITYIDKSYGADTFFPEFDKTQWQQNLVTEQAKDDAHDASYQIIQYTRIK
jgi:dihydrofolate reductase